VRRRLRGDQRGGGAGIAPDDFWALGDYAAIAPRLEDVAEDLVDTANLVHGSRVLDVAAGTGNVAVEAARRGARVLACDLSPAMVEAGQKRTRAVHLPVEWRVADLQSLPLPDHAMDAALSAFGVMFGPDPVRAASELFRVVRPGGTIALANWAPSGFNAASAEVLSNALPAPPEGAHPLAWGDPDVARERLARAVRLELFEREAAWEFESLETACAWVENGPPWAAARASVEPARYEELQGRLHAVVERFAEPVDSGVVLRPPYLVVRARVR
jgi:SAM-dependent methyltransferase